MIIFKKQKKIVDPKTGQVTLDTRQIWSLDDLSQEELAGIQEVNGKVFTISNPGIFNNREDALKNAAKQNITSTNAGGMIVVMNPPTGKYNGLWLASSLVSELMYVGYDQLNNKVFQGYLPATNAEKLNQDIYHQAQNKGWAVDTSNHSRGGITASVALKDWVNHKDINGVAPIRKARFFGTAANAEDYAKVLQKNGYIYMGKDGKIYSSGAYSIVHKADFVGNRWLLPLLLLGNNDTSGGNCLLCYSHSSYFAEVPDSSLQPEDYRDFVAKWGKPKEIEGEQGKYINHAIPQLVKPNKPNGEKDADKNPF